MIPVIFYHYIYLSFFLLFPPTTFFFYYLFFSMCTFLLFLSWKNIPHQIQPANIPYQLKCIHSPTNFLSFLPTCKYNIIKLFTNSNFHAFIFFICELYFFIIFKLLILKLLNCILTHVYFIENWMKFFIIKWTYLLNNSLIVLFYI